MEKKLKRKIQIAGLPIKKKIKGVVPSFSIDELEKFVQTPITIRDFPDEILERIISLTKDSPSSILNLCTTNIYFSNLCKGIFYPYHWFTNLPKDIGSAFVETDLVGAIKSNIFSFWYFYSLYYGMVYNPTNNFPLKLNDIGSVISAVTSNFVVELYFQIGGIGNKFLSQSDDIFINKLIFLVNNKLLPECISNHPLITNLITKKIVTNNKNRQLLYNFIKAYINFQIEEIDDDNKIQMSDIAKNSFAFIFDYLDSEDPYIYISMSFQPIGGEQFKNVQLSILKEEDNWKFDIYTPDLIYSILMGKSGIYDNNRSAWPILSIHKLDGLSDIFNMSFQSSTLMSMNDIINISNCRTNIINTTVFRDIVYDQYGIRFDDNVTSKQICDWLNNPILYRGSNLQGKILTLHEFESWENLEEK